MNARPYISPHRMAGATKDWSAISLYSRPTRHRVVPGESRLVMFFRLNGERWSRLFAEVAVVLAVAVFAAAYFGGGR
jgi:hypothetical protein